MRGHVGALHVAELALVALVDDLVVLGTVSAYTSPSSASMNANIVGKDGHRLKQSRHPWQRSKTRSTSAQVAGSRYLGSAGSYVAVSDASAGPSTA